MQDSFVASEGTEEKLNLKQIDKQSKLSDSSSDADSCDSFIHSESSLEDCDL
jgi:hypothetical protein